MAAFAIPQTDFSVFPDEAYEGMVADSSLQDFHTGYTEVAMAPGRGVVKGASSDTVKLPTTTGEVTSNFAGVTRYEAGQQPIGSTELVHAANTAVALMKKGAMYVVPFGAALVDDGQVFCVHSGANAGKFAGTVLSAGDLATLVVGAKVRKGAVVGAFAIVDFDLP